MVSHPGVPDSRYGLSYVNCFATPEKLQGFRCRAEDLGSWDLGFLLFVGFKGVR